MSDVAGTWNITISTLFGSIKGTLDLSVDGTAVTGTGRADGNEITISGGTFEGDTLTVPVKLTSPMAIDATVEATITGDTLKGKVTGGPVPGIKISGTRA